MRTRKRYTKPLPSITKKTEREKEALRMNERKPKKKKKVKERLKIIRKLNMTKVAWLNRYVPVAIKTRIQEITKKARMPRYSNWAIAGFPSIKVVASGKRHAYAVTAEREIAIESGMSMSAKMTTCWVLARSLILRTNGFFISWLQYLL